MSVIDVDSADENGATMTQIDLEKTADSGFNSKRGKGASLVWKDLTVTLKKNQRLLLKNATGFVEGGFWAVMGPSGGGKTTLINALACRTDHGMSVGGEKRLNGRLYSSTELKAIAGYVMQDSLLNAYLTVEETLYFVSLLRLPSSLTAQERSERMEEVIDQMGINSCRTTIVGNPLVNGISGSERKRLCVAMELITHPLLLFLDEPTTGLDSATALSLTSRLKLIAATGTCTIICSIHQPQTKIFNLFDNVIVLCKGYIVYQGDNAGSLTYYAANGFPCPPFTNPADHLLEVVTPPLPASASSTIHTASTLSNYDVSGKLIESFVKPNVNLELGIERPVDLNYDRITLWQQYVALTKKSLMAQKRKANIILTNLVQNAVIALLIGFAFFHIGTGETSVTKRQSVLFFCCINQGVFGAMYVINSFPAERMLFLRERASGMYNVSTYFLAQSTGELIPQILTPIVFSCIVYFIIGLQAVASKFFLFLMFMVLGTLASTSVALAISALCRTADLSVTVLPMVLEIARLFGGFFLPPAKLPKYFSWIDAFSFFKYNYVGVALNELHGLEYSFNKCDANNYCTPRVGQDTIDDLDLDYITIGGCAGALIAFTIGFRIIAYLGLRYLKH